MTNLKTRRGGFPPAQALHPVIKFPIAPFVWLDFLSFDGNESVMTFDDLVWQHDRMILGNLVFRLQHHISSDWDLDEKCFIFYKIRPLVDQYAKLFASMPGFRVKNMLELGLWDGGSTAFWFELLQPNKYVGIDNSEREDSAYFQAYVSSRMVADRIRTYWGTDQTDSAELLSLVTRELGGGLNLVIDDASHQYEPTKRSFEILFPCVEPGGLYIIEDWAWSHWAEFQAKDHPWADRTPLTRLVFDLIEATGSWPSGPTPKLIESIAVYQGFAAVERGYAKIANAENFRLEQCISRKPDTPKLNRALRKLKRSLDRHVLWRFQ